MREERLMLHSKRGRAASVTQLNGSVTAANKVGAGENPAISSYKHK